MKLSDFNIIKDIQEGNIKMFEEVFINYSSFLNKFAEGYVSYQYPLKNNHIIL